MKRTKGRYQKNENGYCCYTWDDDKTITVILDTEEKAKKWVALNNKILDLQREIETIGDNLKLSQDLQDWMYDLLETNPVSSRQSISGKVALFLSSICNLIEPIEILQNEKYSLECKKTENQNG